MWRLEDERRLEEACAMAPDARRLWRACGRRMPEGDGGHAGAGRQAAMAGAEGARKRANLRGASP
eukprot:8166829-Prorocentrum_lima.AAC.1